MVEIKDRESAAAWLETQDHQTQVWFAARCALRGLPGLGSWDDATKSGLAFKSLRATVISAAAAKRLATRLREIDDARRLKAAELIEDMREGTGPNLSTRFALSAEITRDGSSDTATADAIKESGNHAGKISILERAKRAESSGGMALTKIGMRAQGFAEWSKA
jgi:hypothetical protein